MTPPPSRACWFAIWLGMALLVACDGSGGGGLVDTRRCEMQVNNGAWLYAQLIGIRIAPVRCPYVVQSSNAVVIFEYFVTDPRGIPPEPQMTGLVTIFNQFGTDVTNPPVLPSDWHWNGFTSVTLLHASWRAATPSLSAPYQDEAHIELWVWDFDATSQVLGTATVSLPGAIEQQAVVGPIYGDSTIAVGTSKVWYKITGRDTISYSYQWRVNGQAIAGEVGDAFGTTFSSPGTRTLSVITTRTDNTVDTASLAVTATYTASIAGPSSVHKPCTVEYSAVPAGGVLPLSYSWKVNGSAVGTNSASLSLNVNWTGGRSLTVAVTDNAGNVASGSMTVTGVTTGQCIQ